MRRWHSLNVSERRQLSPTVAVSTVGFALAEPWARHTESSVGSPIDPADRGLWVPLVRRVRPPFKGAWALPGGPTQWDQTLGESAHEYLVAATAAEPNYLEQLYAFGSVERSAEAERTVTIAYWAQFRERDFHGGHPPDDSNLAWFNTTNLPELAFDHADIIEKGLERLRKRAEQTLVAHRFLGESFTLAQLREVHEVIVGKHLDPANFRRQILASGEIEETGTTQAGAKHRPAKYYRFIQKDHS